MEPAAFAPVADALAEEEAVAAFWEPVVVVAAWVESAAEAVAEEVWMAVAATEAALAELALMRL